MIRDGKLFVIEGPDGSGKTTMVSHLIARLHKENIPVEDIALPNPDCILYKEIREYLTKQDLDIDVLQSMMINNMRDCFENIIVPKIESGINIILDRWAVSTIIYNIVKNGNLIKKEFLTKDNEIDLERVVRVASSSLWPDRIFYLNTPLCDILNNAMKRFMFGDDKEVFDKTDSIKYVYYTYQDFYKAVTTKGYKFDNKYPIYEFKTSVTKDRHTIINPELDYSIPAAYTSIYLSMEDKIFLEILKDVEGVKS